MVWPHSNDDTDWSPEQGRQGTPACLFLLGTEFDFLAAIPHP